MDKNESIKLNLENLVHGTLRASKKKPFSSILKQELKDFKSQPWFASPGVDVDELKKEHETELMKLMDDDTLQVKMDGVLDHLINPNDTHVQDSLRQELYQCIEHLKVTKKENENSKYNLLFFEHDFDNLAFLSGYEDLGYQFNLLSGKEYLKFDYNRAFYSSENSVNYNPFLLPILNLEEDLGEDKVDIINETLEYFYELKALFIQNAYLALHICFEKNAQDIRHLDSPFHEQVYVFANEHDCEQMNIYVL